MNGIRELWLMVLVIDSSDACLRFD